MLASPEPRLTTPPPQHKPIPHYPSTCSHPLRTGVVLPEQYPTLGHFIYCSVCLLRWKAATVQPSTNIVPSVGP